MKVAQVKNETTKPKNQVLRTLTEDTTEFRLDKTNSVTFDLRTTPADADSPKYRYMVRILTGNETVQEILHWKTDVLKVCQGLNCTDRDTRRPIMEACMRTVPLANFHAALHKQAEDHWKARITAGADAAARGAIRAQGIRDQDCINDHLDVGLNFVVQELLPRRVLARAKRDLRRFSRKPWDMKVRNYYQAVGRINDEELPQLPPFAANQSLSNDEVLDILLHGTPKSWQVEMDRQGFDPLDKTIPEVVDFMENIEAADEHSRQSETVQKKKNPSSNNGKKDKNKSNGKRKPTHFCKEHGPNFSHSTEECRTLAYKKGDSSEKKKKSYPNKTWVRKANEANSTSKKELAAFVQKEVKKGVKKQLAAVSKKRKNDSDSESESEEKDCFLLEELSKGIDGFNYNDMEKLSIHDAKNDDEVSV